MRKKSIFLLFCLGVACCAFGRHDGKYLHDITTEHRTPHLNWGGPVLKTLFIVPRTGAREVVELVQRMPMDYTPYVTYNHTVAAVENMYDAAIQGTSIYEKKQELLEKLNNDYDLIVIGNFPFTALPEEAQYRMLMKVMNGTGLLLISPTKTARLPYRKIYENPVPAPRFLMEFPAKNLPGLKSAPGNIFEAWQMGKGRIAAVSYGTRQSPGLSLTPYIPYSHAWAAEYESLMAFAARCAWWTAKGDSAAFYRSEELRRSPAIEQAPRSFPVQMTEGCRANARIRNADNRILAETEIRDGKLSLPELPAGFYYCDIQLRQGDAAAAFGWYDFTVLSPTGKLELTAPEVVNDRKAFDGVLTLERKYDKPLTAVIELMDSPYNRIWYRRTVELPAGEQRLDWHIGNYHMPALAGYVRIKLLSGEQEIARAERLVFFPDYRIDGYIQMGWDVLPESTGALYAPQLIDRFGWSLGLTHPSANGANARVTAMLNQRFVPYLVRVGLKKSPSGSVQQYSWFFLPPELQKEVSKLGGDENFYRSEVQKLWAAGVAHRIKNLPKYSPVIYNLGDENFFSTEGCYGPSDEQYFREFVKRKYGSIEALNREWNSSYKNFAEVPHMSLQDAKKSGNFAAWFDHRQYCEKMYADLHRFLAAEIKKHDPRARVGAEGSVPGDLEETIESLEFWGPYSNLVEDEALRSFGGDRVRMLWWGGYMSSHGGREKYPLSILGDILKGTVNGSSWYSANVLDPSTGFAVDYSPAQYLKNYMPYLDKLRGGMADLLIRTPIKDSGILVYWSHPSSSARLLDERCSNPNDSLNPLIRYFYRRGIGFEFVSARTLNRLDKEKILFLCGTSALSEKEADAIRKFVENGGTVIADLNPAMLNGFLRPLEHNPLRQLFGDITFARTAAPGLRPVTVNAELNRHPVKFQAQKALAVPGSDFMQVRKFGKGTAILLNFSLSAAENTASPATPFAKFIDELLAGAGSTPEYSIPDSDRSTVVRIRSGNGFDLVGALIPPDKVGSSLKVPLPGERYIYECGHGPVGRAKVLDMDFKDTPYRLYALFDKEQHAPAVKLEGSPVEAGSVVRLDFSELPAGRVYAVRLFNPAGVEQFNRNQVVGTPIDALAVPLAYNDMPGAWRLVIEDIATGLKTEFKLNVTPSK